VRGHSRVEGDERRGRLAAVVHPGLKGVRREVDDDEARGRVIGVAGGRHDLDAIVVVLARWCGSEGGAA
jgi:hypothetical protein